MCDLVVIVYPTNDEAEEMRDALPSLKKEHQAEIGDAVIAVKREDGKVELKQLLDTTEISAWRGGYWCRLIGMMFLAPPLGASIGEASCRAMSNYGLTLHFMKQLSESIQPGNSALFVEFQEKMEDTILQAFRGSGGMVLKASLDPTKEQLMRDAIAAEAAGMTPAPTTYS